MNNVLDDKFDWSTLQLEDLSHPGRVEITDGNIVNFLFDNINLPDSTANEPASHGFFAYKIKPRNDVVVGYIFSSTADIYFDFNPPITTNTATTEIVNPSSVTDFEHQRIKLFPNPTGSILTIAAENPIGLLRIYDLSGRVQRTLTPNAETAAIDVSDLVEGLYFMEIESVDGIEMLKFMVFR